MYDVDIKLLIVIARCGTNPLFRTLFFKNYCLSLFLTSPKLNAVLGIVIERLECWIHQEMK